MVGFAFLLVLLFLGTKGAFGAVPLVEEKPGEEAAVMQQQQVIQFFREKIPGQNAAKADQAARDFHERLRLSSPIAAEKLKQGRMDDDELRSRVEVYLRDHPEVSGVLSVALPSASTREKVAAVLKRFPQAAVTDNERLVLADQFLDKLRERSKTASESLLAGKMTDDEIQSRVEVFLSNLKGESSATTVNPGEAALAAVIESYLKANYGLPNERASSVVLHGAVEAAGKTQEFVIFKKRPSKVRMHIVDEGLVVGVLSYDGTTAWRQIPGRPAIKLAGDEAEALIRASVFDDPLMDYADRGATAKLDEKAETKVLRISLREKDGTDIVSELDPKTFALLTQRTRNPGSGWVETRFSEYRKTNSLNFAYVQEELKDGKGGAVTRMQSVTQDPGLLDQFFAMPTSSAFTYMDFMGGLAMISAQQKQQGAMPNNTKQEKAK